MSEFITRQREERANLIMQMRDVIDTAEQEKRGLVAEDHQKIARIEADIAKLDDSIGYAERAEQRRAEVEAQSPTLAPVVEARGAGDIFRAIANGEKRSHQFGFEGGFPEKRAIVPTVNTVPVSFLDRVYGIARLVGPMLDTSEVITRSSGESLRIPTWTAYSTAATVAAGSAIGESNPTFDSILLTPAKQAFIVQTANELLTDAGYNIEAAIAEQAGNAIGFAVNTLTTTGTTGIVTQAGSGVLAGTTAFTADNLIDLAYSVDGAVRQLPGVGFMANTSSLGRMRKLKDDNGSYLYDFNVGGVDTFAGFAVYENPAMASVATGQKSVIFGHLPSYKIVTTGLEVAMSSEAYFANDITAWRFTYRVDGALTHASHVKYLIHS